MIFYALFRKYPPGEVFRAIQYVDVLPFIAVAVGYFCYVLLCDSYGTAWLLSRFTKPVAARELFAARVATYPISIVNYGAGQAAFAYYIHRKRRIPLADIFGVFFLIMAADIYWVVCLATAGSFIHDYRVGNLSVSHAARGVGAIAFALLVLHLIFWRLGHARVFQRLPFWSRFMQWLKTKHLTRIFHEATLWDYGRLALLRLPIHAMFPIAFYSVACFFDTALAFRHVIGTVPIVILIGTIPITPGGLGTANVALVELLHPFLSGGPIGRNLFTSQELIFAMSLLWMFANYFQKAVVGSFFLLRMSRDLWPKGRAESPPCSGVHFPV